MHPVVVQVDRHGVLRHVGIVDAVAVDLLAAGPLAQLLEVLLQAVGEHLRAFGQRAGSLACGAGRRSWPSSTWAWRRSPVTNWSGCTLNSSSLHGKAPFQNAYCLWLRMPMRLPSSGAPVNTAASQPMQAWRRRSPRFW
jgi:hypothetical protein